MLKFIINLYLHLQIKSSSHREADTVSSTPMPITHAQGTAQQPLSMQVSLSTPTFAVFHQDAPQRTIQLTREGREKKEKEKKKKKKTSTFDAPPTRAPPAALFLTPIALPHSHSTLLAKRPAFKTPFKLALDINFVKTIAEPAMTDLQ